MTMILKILYKHKTLVTATVAVVLSTVAVTFWWNTLLADMINDVSIGVRPSTSTLLWALFTIFAAGLTNYAKGILSGYTTEKLTHDLRMGYAHHFLSLPVMEAEKISVGEQLSKLQNEIVGVSNYISTNLFQLLDDAVKFISTFFWLCFLNPMLTLSSNSPVFLIVIYIFWSSKAIQTATIRSLQAKGRMNQYADTLITMFPVVLLFDASKVMFEGYQSAVMEWEAQTTLAERLRARLMSPSALMSVIPLLLLLLVGGHMTIRGSLSIGTLYVFMNLSGNVSGVMMNMPGAISAFRQFLANMKRLEGSICLY
ncbi:MAG: ABC transporter ATP-binding protein [Lachnospiraceae bacterium]|jgi:ABC-type multidrug transport system fused ATPase/permease subunit|nr:ABC transporter ATP-binding protein [Lachnospiraceae bacterium]